MSVPVSLKSMKQMDAEGAMLISVLRTEIYKLPEVKLAMSDPTGRK